MLQHVTPYSCSTLRAGNMKTPAIPSIDGLSSSDSALLISGFAYGGAVLSLLLAMVYRAAVERRLSTTASRPWLRFQQIITVSLILRCLWLVLTAKHWLTGGTSAHCLTGLECAGPIFVTIINRLSMMLFFGAFAIVAAQLLRIGRVGLGFAARAAALKNGSGSQSDGMSAVKPSNSTSANTSNNTSATISHAANNNNKNSGKDAAKDGPHRAHHSSARADSLIFRVDLLYLILSVWLLIAQIFILLVCLFAELSDSEADNIYEAYVVQAAVLSGIHSITFCTAAVWIWRFLTRLIKKHRREYLKLIGDDDALQPEKEDGDPEDPANYTPYNALYNMAAAGTRLGQAAVQGVLTVAKGGKVSQEQNDAQMLYDAMQPVQLPSGQVVTFTTIADKIGAKSGRSRLLRAPVPEDDEAFRALIAQQISAEKQPKQQTNAMGVLLTRSASSLRKTFSKDFRDSKEMVTAPLLENDTLTALNPVGPLSPMATPTKSPVARALSMRDAWSRPKLSEDEAVQADMHKHAFELMWSTRWRLIAIIIVSAVLLVVRSVMFLWRPASGKDISGFAGTVVYPWFFYTVPEIVPALLFGWFASGFSISCRRRRSHGCWCCGITDLIRLLSCQKSTCCGLTCRRLTPAPQMQSSVNSFQHIAGAILAYDDGTELAAHTRAFIQALGQFYDVDKDGLIGSATQTAASALREGGSELTGMQPEEQKQFIMLHSGQYDRPV